MSEGKTKKPVAGLHIKGHTMRYGMIGGSKDPKKRRRVLQVVIHGEGWFIGATPILVYADKQRLLRLGLDKKTGGLVCLLDPVPAEGAVFVVQQGGMQAMSPEPFSRRKLPKKPSAKPVKKKKR